jgi:DNA primase large subunit
VFNSDRALPKGEVTAGQVSGLAAGRHFPLCMHIMYDRLASESHLKHNGRLELGLFLKAIGMPLEQALLFWRTMFGPR